MDIHKTGLVYRLPSKEDQIPTLRYRREKRIETGAQAPLGAISLYSDPDRFPRNNPYSRLLKVIG
jgi:hypothetical protein